MTNIEAKARSESMNKWIGVFEKEFDVEADGSNPTGRMKDLIEKLKNNQLDKSEHQKVQEEFIKYAEELLIRWYQIGAQRGVIQILEVICKKELIDDDKYKDLPEKIRWKMSLNYVGLDGGRIKIPSREYGVNLGGLVIKKKLSLRFRNKIRRSTATSSPNKGAGSVHKTGLKSSSGIKRLALKSLILRKIR